MKIRPATIGDMPALMSLIRDCISTLDENGIDQWDGVYPGESVICKDLEAEVLYVADDDGRVCAMIALNGDEPGEYGQVCWNYRGKILVVHRLAVAPEYQRIGLATRLMDFAEDLAWIEGYDSVRLDAFSGNPAAVALYMSRNYRKAGSVSFRKGTFFCFEKRIGRQDREREQTAVSFAG